MERSFSAWQGVGLWLMLAIAACNSSPTAPTPTPTPTEDLDMRLADFANIQGFAQPSGRGYLVANQLGHESVALAVASSAFGGNFPVGSIVERVPSEVMVKRRKGFNYLTNDWEFFAINFASDGKTPLSFAVRGSEQTSCFQCHQTLSSLKWDFICQHP
jgi:hypothetical protein